MSSDALIVRVHSVSRSHTRIMIVSPTSAYSTCNNVKMYIYQKHCHISNCSLSEVFGFWLNSTNLCFKILCPGYLTSRCSHLVPAFSTASLWRGTSQFPISLLKARFALMRPAVLSLRGGSFLVESPAAAK